MSWIKFGLDTPVDSYASRLGRLRGRRPLNMRLFGYINNENSRLVARGDALCLARAVSGQAGRRAVTDRGIPCQTPSFSAKPRFSIWA